MRPFRPIGLLLLAHVLSGPTAWAQPREDTKLWLSAEGEVELTIPLDLELEQQLRVGADSGFDETFTQLSGRYRLTPWLALGAGYRFIVRSDEHRHRGHGDLALRHEVGIVELQYRLRAQATTRPGDDTLWVVRNRGKVGLDAPRRLTPFAAIELFHAVSPVTEYREFRFYLGVSWRASKRVELEAFYLRLLEENVAEPERNHVFGVGATFLLRRREEGAPAADPADD